MSVFNIFLWNVVCMCLTSCWIFYCLNVVISFNFFKSYQAKTAVFRIFSYFHRFFLQTFDLHNFLNFHWILLKLSMLIPLIAIYFFYFQCCYQLSKAKKLLGENVYIFIKFRAEFFFFRSSKVSWTKTLHQKRYLLSAHSSVIINLIISKNKLAFTVTVLQKNVKNLWKCVEIDKKTREIINLKRLFFIT